MGYSVNGYGGVGGGYVEYHELCGHLVIDHGLETAREQFHLIGARLFYRYGEIVVPEYTQLLVFDCYFLDSVGYVDKYLTYVLFGSHYAHHASVKYESFLRGDNANKRGNIAVLVTHHRPVGVCRQVILKQAETLH